MASTCSFNPQKKKKKKKVLSKNKLQEGSGYIQPLRNIF